MQTHSALDTYLSHDSCTHGVESLMRRLDWRRLFAMLVGLVMLALSGHASAQATCTGTAQIITLSLPATITVPANAAVGTRLTAPVTSPATTNYYNCNQVGSWGGGMNVRSTLLTPSGVTFGTTPIWKTNVPGIGVYMRSSIYCGNHWTLMSDMVAIGGIPQNYCATAGQNMSLGAQIQITLVKTGPITPGTVSGLIALGSWYSGESASDLFGPNISFVVSPIAIVAPTCTFSVPNIALGSFSADSFTGNTSTPEVSVPVTATGCPSDAHAINMSFTGTADTTNPALFAADSVAGNVTGVGIGLKYAPPSQAAMAVTPNVTTGTWTLAAGNTMQLLANFVQTQPNVTAGSVSTPVTIQFTYQ